jgi:hypothetical protein
VMMLGSRGIYTGLREGKAKGVGQLQTDNEAEGFRPTTNLQAGNWEGGYSVDSLGEKESAFFRANQRQSCSWCPEDGGSMLLWNVSIYLQIYTVPKPRRTS